MNNSLTANYKGVLPERLRRWLDKRTFRAHKLREVLVGSIATIVLCEVSCYRMLQSVVRYGGLPPYVPETTIIAMALLEAMVSPFVSWFGYWRRRTIMVVVMPALVLSTMSWLFLPDLIQRDEPEFCHDIMLPVSVTESVSKSVSIRLGFVLCTCVVYLLARVAVWCHGFAYIEEHAPERVSVHLGVLIFTRTISLALDYHMVGMAVRTFQVVSFIINFVVQILQILYFMPRNIRTTQDQERLKQRTDDRNFFVSNARVLSDPLALSQMISLGLIVAALWGIGYHNTDIIKVKYLIYEQNSAMLLFTELFQYYGILMAVLYVGLKWSKPIQAQFCKLRAIKQSLMMCVSLGILLLVLALTVKCERGKVAGLESNGYIHPSCSAHCGCIARWMEFSPVCVVDEMTTYLSPCHAGCAGVEHQGGLMVYTNCTCAASSRAVPGACSDPACQSASLLYRMLYVLVLTFSVLAIQSHSVLLLKTVDARDKSVVLGLAGSVVCMIAFVLGHLGFNLINSATCVWFESKRCHMNSPRLPYLVGVVGAALAFTSATICLVTVVCLIKRKKKVEVTTL